MKVHFDAGDIIITKAVKNPTNLKEGQIITFYSTVYQETTTHMIHRVEKDSKGNVIGYVTFGTRTGAIDKTSDGKAEEIVEPGLVFGIYSAKLPGAGNFFAYMKTTPGYIVCILVPFMLLIIYNGVNVIRLFRTYKREQNAVIEAERAEIAAQRISGSCLNNLFFAYPACPIHVKPQYELSLLRIIIVVITLTH